MMEINRRTREQVELVRACHQTGRGKSAEEGAGYRGSCKKVSGKREKCMEKDNAAGLLRDIGSWGRGGPEPSEMEEDHCKPNLRSKITGA